MEDRYGDRNVARNNKLATHILFHRGLLPNKFHLSAKQIAKIACPELGLKFKPSWNKRDWARIVSLFIDKNRSTLDELGLSPQDYKSFCYSI